MEELITGPSQKMRTEFDPLVESEKVKYFLQCGANEHALNPLIGEKIQLKFTGEISCLACARSITKSFQGGYCFPCMRSLARCDQCIVRPELCHFHKGTCREPEWGKEHCFIQHSIYLANASGLKVGITRSHQQLTRWIDQGASQAIVLGYTTKRLDAGLVEVELAKDMSDKTNWRAMLREDPKQLRLETIRQRVLDRVLQQTDLLTPEETSKPVTIRYPVESYPTKITTHNFDTSSTLEGILTGIKGQYLIFGDKVVNIRKYGGYHFELCC